MGFSIVHPTRGRPNKSYETIKKWYNNYEQDYNDKLELIVSVDADDNELKKYRDIYQYSSRFEVNINRSCVDAINNAARLAYGNIIIVVSDDTDCPERWNILLREELEGKKDFLLKTDDGIQDYIVTQTIIDQEYFKRDNFIYHPSFDHQFADTYLTCVADIRGRLIKSDLVFPHNHYSVLKETPDALNKRNDDTWKDGQKTFVRLMKQFTQEERARIKDPSMRGFLKHVGL